MVPQLQTPLGLSGKKIRKYKMDPKWHAAVQKAKKKLGHPEFQIIKGSVLKEAQKIYCALL